MNSSPPARYLPILAATLAFLPPASGENWPGFRGPTHQGISTETNLPLHWTATENVAWKTETPGESWSSPIVWQNHLFITTATENGASCRVLALNAKSGAILWNKEVFKQVPRRKERRNTYATPTPVTDGNLVYAVFGDGSFAALTFDGQIAWTNREFPFYGQHGLGSSPILWEDLLIMARDGSSDGSEKKLGWQIPWDQSFLLALEKSTGKLRWKGSRGLSRIAHVAPNIWKSPDGHTQIISGAGDVVQGFDAKTGQRLWSSKNIGEGVVPSIVLGEDLVFAASGWGGRESLKAFRLGLEGDLDETNLVWEQRKGMPKIPSALYLKPHLFTIKEDGVAMCLQADSGEILWQERVGGNFSASPVSAQGLLYLTSDEGETSILQAGPEFKVLGKNPLNERIQASPAISGQHLFIRTEQHLYAITNKD